jgi:hypothetical protein
VIERDFELGVRKAPASEGGRYKGKRIPRRPGEPGPYKAMKQRQTQEHSPFGFAQGRQEWLCCL